MGDKSASKVLLGTTPKGKEIYYVARPNSTVRFIALGSGGILPKMLEGGFNSVAAAQAQCNSYLASLAQGSVKEEASPKAK